jgi:hypothetical protein
MNQKKISNGTINVCVLVFPGSEVGLTPRDYSKRILNRIKRDIDAANRIWKQQVNGKREGVTFKLVHCMVEAKNRLGISNDAQQFPWNQDEIGEILFKYGRRFCPNAHVFVFYMNGNSIGPIHPNGSHTDAITFRDVPVIIMSNGSSSRKYILAHELGHIMYLSNLYGDTKDPNPFPGDPDHNIHPTNLMFPRSDYWPESPLSPTLTPAQIRKALNTRFFYE